MLQDGQRGVVIQRDRQTYAVAPHLPCGVTAPAMLRKIADVAEKYHAVAIKCTSAQRIAIIGIQEQDVDRVWKEFGEYRPGHMVGDVVRSVKACPGTQFCKRAWQDSLQVGLELDAKFHGKHLPGKFKIGVAGCPNQCAETSIKDIGLVGGRFGWLIMIGGAGGSFPRLGKQLLEDEVPTTKALAIVDALVKFFSDNAEPGERFGDLIDRITFKKVQAAVMAVMGAA